MNVGIYCRISFADEGDDLGVKRQEVDARNLCERLGWSVGRVFTDNSVSAYKRYVIRPEWEALLTALEGGTIGGIVSYDVDRIARQPRDLERLIDIYEANPKLVFATVSGEIDLSKSDGRLMARIMVSFANKSSADTGRRVARKHLELAQLGKISGGGTRPYGYEIGGKTVREAEAQIIRQLADRVMAGESLTSIAKSLDAAGVPTASGSGNWDRAAMRRILTGPRVAGFRVYRGSMLMDSDGKPVKGEWPAILDETTWEAVRLVLLDQNRNFNAGRIDRKYLLSGFLRCGRCQAKMYGVHKRGLANYMCPVGRGCGNCIRRAEAIDAHITELVLRYLESQEVGTDIDVSTDVDDHIDTAIKDAEQSLANLIAEWDAGRMSDQVFFAAQARKEATLNTLKRQRAGERRRQLHVAPVGHGARQIWEAANLSQRRAILADVVLAIQVMPKPLTAAKRFDPAYYRMQWKQIDA